MNTNKISKGKGTTILYLLATIGIVLIITRLLNGFTSITNLSDGYPWGLWIGVDIMAGIAMTTGGLILATLVLIFGIKKYHQLLQPAILTAFLGYVLEIIGLIPDLGRPWALYNALFYWNNSSVMFVVAWCVILQTIVLATIFAPVIFEKLKLTRLQKSYNSIVPWVACCIITFFVFLISKSMIWTGITFVLFLILMFTFKSITKNSALLLLSIIGLIISVTHQQALGSLFLIIPEKLSGLWFSPMLQINFLLSSIALGLGMIIFECTLSSKVFGCGLDTQLLKNIGKFLLVMLIFTVISRFITLYFQTNFVFDNAGTTAQLTSFWLEIFTGLIIPIILLLLPSVRNSSTATFWVAILVVFGVILNRINVAFIGINRADYPSYYPNLGEIFITVGIFSIGLLLFYNISRRFSIFANH
ncbi:MAG: hypothetical protein A2046_03155 [Bacteroidetes bacterium GWA2_30_7]|nr:MAG: hypothetical protein A2046_03155 [Bacteroidetes bacterium GWA2_30_7]